MYSYYTLTWMYFGSSTVIIIFGPNQDLHILTGAFFNTGDVSSTKSKNK